MKKVFSEFAEERNKNIKNRALIYEGFSEKNINKAFELIDSILKKHINGLIPLVGFVNTLIDGKEYISKQYIVCDKNDYNKSSSFQLNWTTDTDSTEIYSIDFFKDLTVYWKGEGKSDLTIYTLGSSIVYFLPIIWSVVNSKNYSLSQEEAKNLSSKVFSNVKESKYNIGNLTYKVYKGLSKKVITEAFILETEATDLRRKKSEEISKAIKSKEDPEIINSLRSEYAEICKAIQSGAESLEDVKLSISKKKNIKLELPKEVKEAEKELNDSSERKDPEQVFKEMDKYINLVIKGLQPSLILCGAPGVGKTFRVKKKLKANDYVEGENMNTIKGKCTVRKLYLSLYEMREKKQITLIDDADSLVGPKAPEDCINILKAALDSSEDEEGRLVTYGVAGKILDDEGNEIPKRFYYNGGVIVITNYQAGSLDTALRGRSFIQDIHFDNSDVLAIVKKLIPSISPDLYSEKAKNQAYEYLEELNKKGSEMELSIRTFVLCTKIFEACSEDDEFNEEDAKSMIEEQMKLQYARSRGEKY